MSKSKYSINPVDIYNMSTTELKKYIRGASKSLSKKIKAFQKSPYGTWSQTLEYIENSGSLWSTGKSMFATQGLTQSQLMDKAFFVNVLSSFDESPAEFNAEWESNLEYVLEEARRTGKYDEAKEFFSEGNNHEMLKVYFNKKYNLIMQYIGSDEVNRLSKEYGEDAPEFYFEAVLSVLHEVSKSEERRQEFFTKRRRKK